MVLLAAASVLTAGCATVRLERPSAESTAAASGFVFARDTFAFRNEIRARQPEAADLYANYCFVLAKAVRQFFLFARFDPTGPRLDHEGYLARVRQVVERAPWQRPVPPEERVVIPGYANLRDFSRGEEPAVKQGLGGRFWTLVHWTNWRVTFPVTAAHQESVAHEVMDELRAGRLAQLLVTNWPKPELNHTVVAFAYRDAPEAVEFVVWDPNDPDAPGVVRFERSRRRFWAERVYDTEPGVIRVFRVYHSWFL